MENDTNSRGIKKNTIYNTIKAVSTCIYPLITFPYISRVLMTENVGKVNFSASIVSYCTLMAALGVTTYGVRECSRFKNDRERLGQTASEILSISLVSTAMAYAILFIALLTAKPLHDYRLLICIQSITVLFSALGADWLNTAMEDFRYITIRMVIMQVLSIVLLFAFVHKPEDYIKYAVITVVASSGANVANILYRRRFCKTKFVLNMNLKQHLPPIMMLFSLLLSQTIYTNSDITILGLLKGDHQVGLYSTAVKIYALVNSIISSIAWVVMPQLSENFSKSNYKEINRLLTYSLNFILVIGLPCICGLEIIAPQIIGWIAGEAYVDAALSLRLLAIALQCSFIGGWIGNMTLIPAGRENICLRASIVCAALNITLNLVLIPLWGLNAAALTTVLAEITGLAITFPYMDKRIKIQNLRELLKAPVIGGAGILLIGYLMQHCLTASWSIVLATVFLSAVWYIVILVLAKNQFFFEFITPVLNKLKRRA